MFPRSSAPLQLWTEGGDSRQREDEVEAEKWSGVSPLLRLQQLGDVEGVSARSDMRIPPGDRTLHRKLTVRSKHCWSLH
ncbi:hypothetical protein PBY51_024540 [Eleginops maclovinus]|uniref:Uncharacterized protein n=1 Tax=Eleginops maclovinus TaxID=56733 RepID=A0AAN7Y1J1_ELEMC|nr:hypothetical protein PBY51_024540 [Eleginops maclovinus]